MRAIPTEAYQIAASAPHDKISHVLSWDSVRQLRGLDPSHVLDVSRRQMADKVAHEFAGRLFNSGAWRETREAEGIVVRLDAYCLTHQQLCELLTDAYNAGYLRRPAIA